MLNADIRSDDVRNPNEMEQPYKKFKLYGSAIEMILLEISEFD